MHPINFIDDYICSTFWRLVSICNTLLGYRKVMDPWLNTDFGYITNAIYSKPEPNRLSDHLAH